MRSGCLRARIVSASRPSRCVGASRYSSSASAADTRPPSITFATIASTMLRRTPAFGGVAPAQIGGVVEEHLQPRRFLGAQAVLHIIP